MSEKYKIQCKICGREFESSYKHAQICSEECREENKKLHARKQTADRREKNRALMGTRFCTVCGKEFPIKNWNQKVCSKECVLKHRSKTKAINKRKKKEQIVAVAKQKEQKMIPLVKDSVAAQKAGTSYGKHAAVPYLAKQSEEMAKRRRELDAEWEKKRNEKKNVENHDEVLL